MEVERQIILEEMLDEVDEKGRDIDLDNLAKKEMFNGHPLSLKIAGTAASVRALTEEQLRDHFARYYVAENLVFAAAGKVSRQRVLESVRASFDRLPRGKRSSPKNAPPGVRGPSFKFVRHNEAQTAFRLSFRAVPEHHPDFPALALIRRILDDGLSSRLPFNIVERRGLAYSVHAGMELFDDLGLFEIEAASAPEKAAAVFEEVCRTLAEIKTTRIRGEELNRAKRRYRIHLGFAQDSPGDLAAWFGGTELFRTPDSFEQSIRRVEARSAPRVQHTAQRYFSAENLSVIAVGQNRGIRALRRCVDSARDLLG
jgi:predicted Zn-dependent peptidase